ncbi:MAG: TraB/GumN family protein [Candidatus Nanohaloarchaea archaeon]
MIKIIGTSHVSQKSIERIDQAFEEFDPDVVCLELDMGRLNALITGERDSPDNLAYSLLAKFQKYIGSKTGVMPGEEMLHAYNRASKTEKEIYLIDRDIRETMGRLNAVRRKEKVKALMMLPLSIFGTKFDYTEIPEGEMLEGMKEKFAESFPEIYQAVLEERDIYMFKALEKVADENPGKDILVVVGAAHQKGLEERKDEIDSQSPVEPKQSTLEG